MRVINGNVYFLVFLIIIFFSTFACSHARSFAESEQIREDAKILRKAEETISPLPVETQQNYQVGYRVLDISTTDFSGKKVLVDIGVWYPSSEKGKPFQYTYGKNRVETEVALNGKPATGKFPLIVYSHGATGCGLSMAFLTEQLAREGFVVAAPDYPDEYYLCRTKRDMPKRKILYKLKMLKWIKDLNDHMLGVRSYRPKLAYRPMLAKATIDLLLAENRNPESPFHGLINESEIGLVGHSFGAWTSILVGGGDPSYKDPRVKAIVSFSSPVYKGVYEPSDMANIRIPAMFIYGEKESKHRDKNDQMLYDEVNAPKFLLQIKGANHLTFSGGIRKEFSTISDYRLKDPIRATIVNYTVAFLNYYIKKDKGAKRQLEVKSDGLVSYLKDFGVSDVNP